MKKLFTRMYVKFLTIKSLANEVPYYALLLSVWAVLVIAAVCVGSAVAVFLLSLLR